MTKLLSLLAVVAIFTGCTSPLPGNVSRIAPPPPQAKATGEDTWARDLMKADVWDPKQQYALQIPSKLNLENVDGPIEFIFEMQFYRKIEYFPDESTASDFDNDFPVVHSKVSTALMQKLVIPKESALKMELSETYPTTPATQSALVNAIDQPVKLVLK